MKQISKTVEILLQICKKINVVHNTENLFLFTSTCHQYIVNENYGAEKMPTVGNKFAIFHYQFTSTVY